MAILSGRSRRSLGSLAKLPKPAVPSFVDVGPVVENVTPSIQSPTPPPVSSFAPSKPVAPVSLGLAKKASTQTTPAKVILGLFQSFSDRIDRARSSLIGARRRR